MLARVDGAEARDIERIGRLVVAKPACPSVVAGLYKGGHVVLQEQGLGGITESKRTATEERGGNKESAM